MADIKRYLGILWMMISPVLFIMLLISAVNNISSEAKGEINNPIPWIIILAVFLPIAIGLTIFGWYAYTKEFDKIDDQVL